MLTNSILFTPGSFSRQVTQGIDFSHTCIHSRDVQTLVSQAHFIAFLRKCMKACCFIACFIEVIPTHGYRLHFGTLWTCILIAALWSPYRQPCCLLAGRLAITWNIWIHWEAQPFKNIFFKQHVLLDQVLCNCAVVFSKAESVSQQVSISPVQKFCLRSLPVALFPL